MAENLPRKERCLSLSGAKTAAFTNNDTVRRGILVETRAGRDGFQVLHGLLQGIPSATYDALLVTGQP